MARASYENVKTWRYKSKTMALESFDNKCGICGYNKCRRSLSFHHLNSDEKQILFSTKCQSWKKIVNELRKCVLLCSNCHMEVHAGVTEIPDDIKRFDESYATYINSQNKLIGIHGYHKNS